MTAFTTSADAQYKRKKKKKSSKTDEYFDDQGSFTDRLWYGADVSLGFTGFNGQTSFRAGIAPMVGFKVTENLSVGPRAEVLYTAFRIANGGTDLKLNATDYGIGAFSRLKILQLYFLQFEYQRLNSEIPFLDNTGAIFSERDGNNHYFIGGGYTSSAGLVGFQVTALWDLSQEFTSTNIPIVTRIGLNYKF